MADNERGAVIRDAVGACLRGDVAALPGLFTANVSGWSPNLLVSSLDELSEAVGEREGALSDVELDVSTLDLFGSKALMEYRVSAVFSAPFVVDEETTIPPNGRKLEVGCALVAELENGKIAAFRNYFDDASLMEQMLA